MNTFQDPRPRFGQDPFLVTLRTGARLFIESEDEKRIVISDYDRPDAPKKVVWDNPAEFQVWSPELHEINGVWTILYSASDGDNRNHRNKAIRSILPLGPYSPGTATGPSDQWGIDATVFRYDWKLYTVWSGWPHPYAEFPQNLYIAPYLSDERTLLAAPLLDWEGEILEGPQWVNDEYYGRGLFYSANASWTIDYATGFLEFFGDDPLNPEHWARDIKPKAKNFGHAQYLGNNQFIYHKKLSTMPGWTDRVIEEGCII